VSCCNTNHLFFQLRLLPPFLVRNPLFTSLDAGEVRFAFLGSFSIVDSSSEEFVPLLLSSSFSGCVGDAVVVVAVVVGTVVGAVVRIEKESEEIMEDEADDEGVVVGEAAVVVVVAGVSSSMASEEGERGIYS